MSNSYYSSSDYSVDYTTDIEEQEPIDYIDDLPDVSSADEYSDIATSGEPPEDINEPITDEENDTVTVNARPRPIRRIEMFSDEEDMWEFDDGTIHLTIEGNSDDDSHIYSDEEHVTLTEQQLELIDEIDFANDYTKSKIMTATCAYTLEENQRCIRCHQCKETYSAAGLIENYSYHLSTERMCCPTCKTPIETALLMQLFGKDETRLLIAQRWEEKLTTPIYSAYIDTLKLLHSIGVIYPEVEQSSIINLVRSILSMINGHIRPVPIECPYKLQVDVLTLYRHTSGYLELFDTTPEITGKRINRIPYLRNIGLLSNRILQNLLREPFKTSTEVILFVLRSAKLVSYTVLQDHPNEQQELLSLIHGVSTAFNEWRHAHAKSINTPSEIIGMVYQQITELGTITPTLSKLIIDDGYRIFKRHNTPLSSLLDTIIDALVPNATMVQKKLINEIIKCGPPFNPFKGCPIQFLKSLSKGETTCACGGPIIAYTCLLCNQHYCQQCEEPIKGFHQCSPDKISTVKELRLTTIRCPKCCVRIQKSEGCDHMFCTNCHANFNWTTGKLIKESEQTNDMYVNTWSPLEQNYVYYINMLIEDYESYIPSDIIYHKSILCHELSLIRAGIYDDSLGVPSLTIRPQLNTLLKYRIAKETLSALRPAVVNAIQNTLDVLSDTINDYEANAIAERITQRGIIALREIL